MFSYLLRTPAKTWTPTPSDLKSLDKLSPKLDKHQRSAQIWL